MKTINAIAYFRTDLQDAHKDVPLAEIKYQMLSIFNTGVMVGSDLSIFVDDDGSSRIIKNRYGNTT